MSVLLTRRGILAHRPAAPDGGGGTGDYAAEVLTDNPVGFWSFEEVTGLTTVDETANSYDLDHSGGRDLNVVGAVDSGIEYSVGKSTNHSVAAHCMGDLTLEAWIKTTTNNGDWKTIVSAGSSASEYTRRMLVLHGSTLRLNHRNTSSSGVGGSNNYVFWDSSGLLIDGDWHHVVGQFDAAAGEMHLYVDGTLVATSSFSGSISLDRFDVGDLPTSGAGLPFLGSIDEAAVYDAVIADTRIAAHYDAREVSTFVPGEVDFDPSTLTALDGWFAADELSGFSTDDPVGLWDNLQGGSDLEQATGSKQPLYKDAVLNGLPVVEFDGVDDELRADMATGQPWTYSFVARLLTLKDCSLAAASSGTSSSEGLINSASDLWRTYNGSGFNGPSSDTDWHIFTVLFDGSNSYIRVDAAATTGDSGHENGGRLTLARNPANPVFAHMQVAEFLRAAAEWAGTEVTDAEAYLADKWGLTI